ncbi:hypothetical protein [Virgibacillus doumboii]|nr:hypothetical protein [Virgibacillus doumboii]
MNYIKEINAFYDHIERVHFQSFYSILSIVNVNALDSIPLKK